jgi:RNA polymerase sigma-70 factor (ECF subfamily)
VAAAIDPDCEQTWVQEAQTDPRAFEQLYNHYFPRLYAYVSYRVGSKQETEDLVADTFLKAVEGMKRGRFHYRHEGSFAAWLFRIAHNTISDYQRHNRRRDEPLTLDDMPNLRSSTLLPDDVVLRQEQFAHLRSLIATLSPRRQEIITLKFFAGLQNRVIAGVLGLDERTVASHLCRALEDLHRKYLEEPVPPPMENRK